MKIGTHFNSQKQGYSKFSVQWNKFGFYKICFPFYVEDQNQNMANYKLNSKHKLTGTSFQNLTNEGIKQFSKKYTRMGKFVG